MSWQQRLANQTVSTRTNRRILLIVKDTPEEVIEWDDLNNEYIVFDYINLDPDGEPTQTTMTEEEYNEIYNAPNP
jgi:ABC-type sulfate transport system substrate-binding protein